jgi:hypothetical protein
LVFHKWIPSFIAPQRAINWFGAAPDLTSTARYGQTPKTRGIIGIYNNKYKPATAIVGKTTDATIYVNLYPCRSVKAIESAIYGSIRRGFN